MVEYEAFIKDELKKHKIRVHKWGKFNENETYWAYFNSRRVYIPVPECSYSLLLSLHEIGHLVMGNHIYGHIAEYKAEMWAIRTAFERFNIKNEEYESTGRNYIYENILEDIMVRKMEIDEISKPIMKWVKTTPTKIKKSIIKYKL
jgi:hypothetical protein